MFDLTKFMQKVSAYLADQHDADLAEWKSIGHDVAVEVHDCHGNTIQWELKFSLDWTMVTMQSIDQPDYVCFVSAHNWVVGSILMS